MTPRQEVVAAWLAVLDSWKTLAVFSARHITSCCTCAAAELNGGKGYCSIGDHAWEELIEQEQRVIQVLPELRAAGIDVDEECRVAGFQFIERRSQ